MMTAVPRAAGPKPGAQGAEPAGHARVEFRGTRLAALLALLIVLAGAAVVRWRRHFEYEEEMTLKLVDVLAYADSGFDVTRALIPPEEIVLGTLARDSIPSLAAPQRQPLGAMRLLTEDDRVIGVSLGGETVAYPLRLLDRHECINDVVGGVPIAVTYCPLCDSVAVFDRRVGGETLEFGISGRLYNSNVLLYDRRPGETGESLWSQLQGRAVTGPLAGTALTALPFALASWADWRRDHPDSEVVAFPDPPRGNYRMPAYRAYRASETALLFPVRPLDDRLPRRERVVGLAASGEAIAVPLAALPDGETRVPVGGGEATLVWETDTGTLRVVSLPEGVDAFHTFWFAWAAMHPDTAIWPRAGSVAP